MLAFFLLPAALLADTTLPGYPAKSRIHSHLLVPARQQFRLGGGQTYAFAIRGRNTGQVTVDLLEQPTQGAAVWRARLAPGQQARLQVAPGAAVLVRNRAHWRAVLEVDIYARPGLVMTYYPAADSAGQ